MAFNSAIPGPSDKLSISQGAIQSNFTSLGVIAGISATPGSNCLNSSLGFNWVNFALQAGNGTRPPAAAFALDSVGLYSAQSTISTYRELFVASRDYSSGVARQVPMTLYVNNNVGITNGWTYLPSGLIIAWGNTGTGAQNNVTVSYAAQLVGFPGFSTFWTAPQLTRLSGAGTSNNFVTISAYTATSFTVYSSLGTVGVNFAWMVIGR